MRDRSRPTRRCLSLLLVILALATAVGEAQKTTTAKPPSNTGASGSRPTIGSAPYGANSPYGETDGNTSEMERRLETARERAREVDRQKRMVEDANRLVALAARYRASLTEHEHATPEDARMLLEMEKLARSVKDRMRGM